MISALWRQIRLGAGVGSLTLKDAAGNTIAESTADSATGMSQLFTAVGPTGAFGNWTINVRGDLGSQDNDTLMGSRVSVSVAQLAPQTRVRAKLPIFTATGTATYYFQPGASGLATTPEGCTLQAGAPVGGLATTKGAGTCQSGSTGFVVNYTPGAGMPAQFDSPPLTSSLTVGGAMSMRFYLVDPAAPAWQAAGENPFVTVEVDAVDANGDLLLAVGSGEWDVCNSAGVCGSGPQPVGGVYTVELPPVTLPAGSRLSVLVWESAAVASASRTVYGGKGLTANFSDAGVKLTTGKIK